MLQPKVGTIFLWPATDQEYQIEAEGLYVDVQGHKRIVLKGVDLRSKKVRLIRDFTFYADETIEVKAL